MQEKSIIYRDKRLFYRTRGEGPIVVFLHGFGEDGTIWKNQFETLSGFTLIIPDLPGSGQSEMTEDMTMEGLAASVKEILDIEMKDSDYHKATIIGHSMGGYITLAFVNNYPEILKGFGLFHSTAYPDSKEKIETRKKGIEFILNHGSFEFLKTSIPSLYSPVTKEKKPELIEEQIESCKVGIDRYWAFILLITILDQFGITNGFFSRKYTFNKL